MVEELQNPSGKTVIACDASTFNFIEDCYKKAQYSSILNLEPRESQEPLERGSLIHDMLEAYYRAMRLKYNKHPKFENMERMVIIDKSIMIGKMKSIPMNLDKQEVDFLISTFFDYCLHYAQEPEIPIGVELYFSKQIYENDELVIIWDGKIDLYSYNPLNKIYQITDHKSVARSLPPTPLDNQFFGYCFALECNTVVRNEVGLQESYSSEKRFKRQVMNYPTPLIEEWKDNVIITLLDYYRHVKLGVFPRRHRACKYCWFNKICYTVPEARDWKIKMEYKEKAPWSPVTRATDQDVDPFLILENIA